jgi:hypothetical protein
VLPQQAIRGCFGRQARLTRKQIQTFERSRQGSEMSGLPIIQGSWVANDAQEIELHS